METDGNKQAGRAGKIKLRRADDPLLSEQALVNGPEGGNPPPPLLATRPAGSDDIHVHGSATCTSAAAGLEPHPIGCFHQSGVAVGALIQPGGAAALLLGAGC